MTAPKNKDFGLVKATRLNSLVEVFKHDAMVDAAALQAAARAEELQDEEHGQMLTRLTDEQLAQRGWTRRQLHVAIDAKKSRKESPIYLQFAQERRIAAMRLLPTDTGGAEESAHAFVIPATEWQAQEIEAPEQDEGDDK